MAVLKDKDSAMEIANRFKTDQQSSRIENGGSKGQSEGRFYLESQSLKSCFSEILKNSTDSQSDVQWWFQTYVLWIRFLRTWMRNPILFWSEFTQYVFTGVFIGTVLGQRTGFL